LVSVKRSLQPGTYEPPPSAWRHLYKMVARKRTNCRNEINLIEGWIGSER